MKTLSVCLVILFTLLVGCGGGGGGGGGATGPLPFTLSDIGSATVVQGNQTIINLTISTADRTRDAEDEVTVSVEGLPEGVEAAIDPPVVIPTEEGTPCQITITADPGTFEGNYTATVKAVRGEEEATETFNLSVELSGPVSLVITEVNDFAKDADTTIYTATFKVKLDNAGARRLITLASTPQLHWLWAEPKQKFMLVGEAEQLVKIRFPQNDFPNDSLDITTTVSMEGDEEQVVLHLTTLSEDSSRDWGATFEPRDITMNAAGADDEVSYVVEIAPSAFGFPQVDFWVDQTDRSIDENFFAVLSGRFRYSIDGAGPSRKAILTIGRLQEYTGSDAVHVAYIQITDDGYQDKSADYYIPFFLNDLGAP